MRPFLLSCAIISLSATVPYKYSRTDTGTLPADSVLMKQHKLEVLADLGITDSYPASMWDSLVSEMITESKLVYAPDSSFKIFTIQAESCGAYCNSIWYSWIHYKLKGPEKSSSVNINTIKNIYKLPDGKYLVLDNSWERAGYYGVSCESAKLIAFDADSFSMSQPFSYCQESLVQEESFLKYNSRTQMLSYHYGNNDPDNSNDADTIRSGRIKYFEGNFLPREETVTTSSK